VLIDYIGSKNQNMITIDRLRYFVEAALLENSGRAARNLSVSPSVISSAIKTLEQEMNCSLFDKEKNRLVLNRQGEIILEKAKAILAGVDRLHTEIDLDSSQIKGHYKIAASPFLMREYLVDAFLKVKKKHPKLTVELMSRDTGIAVSDVLSGVVDFALVFRSMRHHDLEEKVVYNGNFKIAVRKNHPLLSKPIKQRADGLNKLASVTFKTLHGPNYCADHPIFSKLFIKPSHQYFYNNNDVSIKILKKTDCWAFLPDILIEKYSNVLRPLSLSKEWDAPVSVSLIKNKNRSTRQLFHEIEKNISF